MKETEAVAGAIDNMAGPIDKDDRRKINLLVYYTATLGSGDRVDGDCIVEFVVPSDDRLITGEDIELIRTRLIKYSSKKYSGEFGDVKSLIVANVVNLDKLL